MYMMRSMLDLSLLATGVTVVVLHTKLSPYYNVLHEVISWKLNDEQKACDFMTHHGKKPVCKISDLNL